MAPSPHSNFDAGMASHGTQGGEDEGQNDHAILLYLEYSAEHEKRTQRGVPIPRSQLGAVYFAPLFSIFHI